MAVVAIGLLVGQGFGCHSRSEATSDEPESEFSREGLVAISDGVKAFVDDGDVVGAVAMVVHKGETVLWEAHGLRDRASTAPLRKEDLFRIYSMTKPLTSAAVMMLADEGQLGLSDPLSMYLAEFDNPVVWTDAGRVPARRPITLRDLLTHTGGLTYGVFGDSAVERVYREADLFAAEDLNDFVSRSATLPLVAQPGETWTYSISTSILGRVIEVVSGQTLDEFLQSRIFAPLGMKDTAFFVPKDKVGRFTTSYRRGFQGALEVHDSSTTGRYNQAPGFLRGGGGLVSTAWDYARFAQMLLQGGELDGVHLLRPETTQSMLENQLPEELIPIGIGTTPFTGYGFGFGFSVLTDPGATPVPGNAGIARWLGIGGTYFWIDPVDELFAILLTQHYPTTLSSKIEMAFQTWVYEAIE